MVTVPAATPVTTPVVETTVATAVLLLDQAPPLVASLKVRVLPTAVYIVPVIAELV